MILANLMSESFPVNWSFSGPVVIEKKFLKWSHLILAFL
jgi:hypothetical protein